MFKYIIAHLIDMTPKRLDLNMHNG